MSEPVSSPRILVVDDDEASRYLVASVLSSAGYTADQASNGAEALEVARRTPPELVITDILMPTMDGYQLAREWKSDPVLGTRPLVFLTASYTDPADEKFAIDLGADGFLNKPVDTQTLLDTVADLLGAGADQEARRPSERAEIDVLKDYSQRVVHKLEQKLGDLERANEMLESAMEALSEEVGTKEALIARLTEAVGQAADRERELDQERDLTDRILTTADVFIVGMDPSAVITLFSPGAQRMSGYSEADVLGRDAIEVFAPENERSVRRRLHDAMLEGNVPERLTNAWVMRDGSEWVLEWSFTVIQGQDGSSATVIGFGIDVTARAIAAALQRVTGVIDLAVLDGQVEGRVLDLAAAHTTDEFSLPGVWITLFGLDDGVLRAAAGIAAPALAEVFSADSTGMCPVSDPDALTGPMAFGLDAESLPESWRRLAEESRLSSAVVAPVRVEGRVAGLLGALGWTVNVFDARRRSALQQIADRLGVALSLLGAREQLMLRSAALESAANAIVIADPSGTVLSANPALHSMTGFSPAEALGAHLFDPGSGYREPAYEDAWGGVVAGGTWRDEVKNRTREGVEYVEDVTIAPVRDVDGTVTHVVIVKQDVSERARLDRLKSDFLAMVSHELRTPLTKIIGYADLVAETEARSDPEKMRAAVDSIRVSGARMKDVIEQLLEVTEIQAEGVLVERAPTDVVRLVQEAANAVAFTDRHQLAFDVPDEPLVARVDPRRLTHAVRNIVENAVKYSPRGGPISIIVRDEDDVVSIVVTDQGIGMPEDRIPELFEIFHQSDMSSTRGFGGIGVGLFVAYQFVVAHGGTIEVRSREGHGSSFVVKVPSGARDVADS